MSIAFSFFTPLSSKSLPSFSLSTPSLRFRLTPLRRPTDRFYPLRSSAGGPGGGSFGGHGGPGHGGHGGGGGGGHDNDDNERKNEALLVVAEAGRSLESVPADLAAAIKDGKIPASVVSRFLELEKSPFFRWLLQFTGFRERLLADDLFLAKVAMECGVGVFTKTAAEYEKRRENFFNELEIVFADVAMAIIADFMLVYLPAPTVALRPPLALTAGPIAKFFHGCPDNAFQVALSGASYSLIQRVGAIVRNGAKLFAVGTASSLVGTAMTNAFINAKKAVNKTSEGEIENVPILSTSAAYGVYMAVSSNLRYQVLAGIIEQRLLEPLLHQHKLILSALCFAVRTGNTYLGSLLWVDYARFVGVQ
ncbi:Protein RETICULATA-RELATED 4, chloroplastic [Glycine soja]